VAIYIKQGSTLTEMTDQPMTPRMVSSSYSWTIPALS
jgi:hypothetical protein